MGRGSWDAESPHSLYFDIDNDRVWDTATEELPKLKAIIERYLKEGKA
jgi:uncharacterized protein with HEPN domain